jgi:hypothetical protein
MDELLARRYWLLLLGYDIGGGGPLVRIKRQIIGLVKEEMLRPDAGLYLLANCDQMLFRPYFGDIAAPDGDAMRLPERGDLEPRDLERALGYVLEQLEGERPFSSHAAAQAVEASWERLAIAFGWG